MSDIVNIHEAKANLSRLLERVRRGARLRRLLEQEVWPLVPEDQRGRALTRAEEDAILGYGPQGT